MISMKPSTNWQIGVTPATTTNLVGYSDTSDDDYSDPKRIYLDEVENLNLLLDDGVIILQIEKFQIQEANIMYLLKLVKDGVQLRVVFSGQL